VRVESLRIKKRRQIIGHLSNPDMKLIDVEVRILIHDEVSLSSIGDFCQPPFCPTLFFNYPLNKTPSCLWLEQIV
jgi:hypothetical protein